MKDVEKIVDSNGVVMQIVDGAARDMIAAEYDETESYAVGDYCIYDDRYYKCNTAIPSGGETWDATHWDATTLGAEDKDINSSLSDLGDATLLHTFTAVDSTGVTVDFTPYRTALVAVYDTTWGYMATSYYPIDLFLTAENHWARSLWGSSVVSGSVRYVNSKLQCLYLESGGLSAVVCRVYGLK